MINIQNIDDNECFKWYLVRYLHPADHYPARIRNVDRLSGDELDFEDIKLPIKIRDIHKIDNKNPIGISIFGNENKCQKYICVKNTCQKSAVKENMLTFIDR